MLLPLGSFAKLKAVFSFRRRLDYHISAVYVPEVILVVLSWCTFFITPTAVPARVALSITTILTTILLSSSVNSNIPKVHIVIEQSKHVGCVPLGRAERGSVIRDPLRYTLSKDSPIPLMHHDPSDFGSLIPFWSIAKERTNSY